MQPIEPQPTACYIRP